MKHTQGPWAISDGDECHGPANDILSIRIAHENGGAIADVYSNCLVNTDAECRANAHLIAAAPALLEALQAVTSIYVQLVNTGDAGRWDPEMEHEIQAARAAIAKATQAAA